MPMTNTEIRDQLDLEHIARMAAKARQGIRIFGQSRVLLTPNDGTRYEILVSNARLLGREGFERYGGDYVVVLINFGGSYYWNGHHMESGYVTEKWVPDHRVWTGVVLTEFLNALAAELESS